MIRVIGQLGCSNCEIVKQTLKKKGVEFEYIFLNNLSLDEQDAILDTAEKNGYTKMPLIFNNDELITIAEL